MYFIWDACVYVCALCVYVCALCAHVCAFVFLTDHRAIKIRENCMYLIIWVCLCAHVCACVFPTDAHNEWTSSPSLIETQGNCMFMSGTWMCSCVLLFDAVCERARNACVRAFTCVFSADAPAS